MFSECAKVTEIITNIYLYISTLPIQHSLLFQWGTVFDLHFTDEEIEQSGEKSHQRTYNWQEAEPTPGIFS